MKRFLLLTILLSVVSGAAMALEWTDWSLDFGLAIKVNCQIGDEPEGKYPSILMFNPGASFHLDWDGERGRMFMRPGFWFSWGIEDVYEGIARPADEADISHMKVLGLMLDIPFGYIFQAGSVDIGLQGGPALYLRFPLYTAQEGTGEPSEFWTAYYGAAEFLHLGIAAWASFPLSEELDLLTGIRYYQPLANLWTEAPFAQGLQVGLFASLRFDANRAE